MSKLVIFDLGGVVATTPIFTIQQFAWEKGIPRSVFKMRNLNWILNFSVDEVLNDCILYL